jgi:hypothetical protein
MDGKYTNKSAPEPPRCHSCARPMQLLRKTSRYGELPDLYSFYCLACDEWHVGGRSSPTGLGSQDVAA